MMISSVIFLGLLSGIVLLWPPIRECPPILERKNVKATTMAKFQRHFGAFMRQRALPARIELVFTRVTACCNIPSVFLLRPSQTSLVFDLQ